MKQDFHLLGKILEHLYGFLQPAQFTSTHCKPPPNVDHHVSVASVLGFHEGVLVLQLLRTPVVGLSNAESLSELRLCLRYIQRLLRKGGVLNH